MDKQDLINKVANREISSLDQLKEALFEVYGSKAKTKKAFNNAVGLTNQDGHDAKNNLNMVLINFDRCMGQE